ncbi:FadR/GntR family transcriptional regulator [Arthrobacter sp. Br18]|uniref:FadR/GntR family transcriptional regulator n=1 Tax=Arthrobacter sp. Br18 TaxID=1312954 RepID=UPI000687E664|nr:FadR/GntR family transcriptional regulator [Arthrobacter sp. Br18]
MAVSIRRTPEPVEGKREQTRRAFESVVDHVEQSVLEGKLKAGDRLPSERELVNRFAVSRSSVREAMRVLESNGVLSTRPGDPRGAVILAPTPDPLRRLMTRLAVSSRSSLADLLIYRMTLESAASSLAATRRSAGDLLELEKAMARMTQCLELGFEEFSRADLDFHDVVARISGNPMIQISGEAVRESIEGLIRGYLREHGADRGLMRRTLHHHREAFEAIRNRDAHLAEHLARSSIFEYYGHLLGDADRRAIAALASFGTPVGSVQ